MTLSEGHLALVALLTRAGPDAPGLADRIDTDGARRALAEELEAGTSLLPEDPGPLLDGARNAITSWERAGLRLLTVLDADYPANLRAVHDRPPAVLVAGDAGLLTISNGIAIVGTRRPTDDGLRRAERFAAEIAHAGRPVLSGLALGIDTAAHRAAIAAGGRTVAVIATGHDRSYPPENAGLQAQLSTDHAVVSAFPPGTRPSAERFRRRNGLMSGLGRGTVIVEASVRSGTRVQARLALAHGRPVFLCASLIRQAWARELAERPGVHVVQDAGEVLATLARIDGPLTG